jgi:hypothetical protein
MIRSDSYTTLLDATLCDESGRQTIAAVCDCAPDNVSLLRRIDVALWMHATKKSY